jgi:hypothetical protein
MKNKLLLLLLVLTVFKTYSQTIYTFNGIGEWTDVSKWNQGNYPGTTVDENEIIEILGKLTISETTTVTNNGTIESFSSANGDTPEVNILGVLENNKDITFNRTPITVGSIGRILTNARSQMTIASNSKLTNTGNITLSRGTISITSSVSSIVNEVNGSINNNGTLRVLNGLFENRFTLNNSGLIEVGVGTATFTNKYELFNNPNGFIMSSGKINNEGVGEIVNEGQITVKGFGASFVNFAFLTNSNSITIEESATINMTNTSSFSNINNGNIRVSTDSSIINGSANFKIRAGKITNGGTIDNNNIINIDTNGQLENNGNLKNNFGAKVVNLGILSGINTSHTDSFSNDGIFSPGNNTDTTGFYKLDTFFTSFTQTATGVLNIDLGGTIAGDTYDQVVINRNITLNGTLNVTLVNGFEPAVGDIFTILRKGRAPSGTFSTINLPILSAGKEWNDVDYNSPDGVQISVKAATLSVADVNKDSLKFKFYPNPVSDKIFISGVLNTTNVSIFDLNGRKIMESILSKENAIIDLNKLASGVYLLNVKGESYKFIKI